MLYIKDDFYSNFTAIANSNDTKAMRGIMIDQISNIIADRRNEVIDLIQKSGIKISKQPNNQEIVKAISNNIKTNKKLLIGLSYLVAKQNDILQSEFKMNRDNSLPFDGTKTPAKAPTTKQPTDWNKFAETTKTIADTFSVTADALTGAKAGTFEGDLLSQTNIKSPEQIAQDQRLAEESERRRRKRNRGIAIFIGLLALGGGIYWAYTKGYFKKGSTGGTAS